MNTTYNYISVSKPKLPVYSSAADASICFGEFFVPENDPTCAVEEDVAQVSIHDMLLPNFSVRRSRGKFLKDAVLFNTSAEGIDLLGSCLFLKGSVQSHFHRRQDQPVVQSLEGHQNFKYDPQNEYSHRIASNIEFDIVHFSVSPEYFIQFLPSNEMWAERLHTIIVKGKSFLGDRSVQIRRAQVAALQNVLHCPLKGRLGEMMMETAIVQIILLQLDSLFQRNECAARTDLSKRDIGLVHDLRDHLTKTFLEDHSLTDLARNFATNTNKLITTFKKVFGRSIFDYLQELRMDHARELLLEGDVQITEVARILKYKNPNHFSSAFKKHFGVSPSSVK